VFGAGSIGSLFGGILSKRYDVTLLGRKKHMDEIKKNGLKITGKTNRVFYPKTGTKRGGKYDLIILTVKAYDTKKSMNTLKSIIDSNTIILSLQNGLGNEEIIANSIGLSKGCDGKSQRDFPSIPGKTEGFSRGNKGVLRGITNHGVIFVKPGEIHHSGMGETVIGEIDGKKTERIKKICSMFNNTGIKTKISNDIKKDVWAKTIINSAINPVTAITGLKNGYLLKIPMLTGFMGQVCLEGVRVANKSGVFFDSDVFEETKKTAGLTAENKSSMLQDLQNRKKTEIDFINGAIAKTGKMHGIETPLNSMLTVLVKVLEKRNM
jgi:2-dehydropantoate 2-reductase